MVRRRLSALVVEDNFLLAIELKNYLETNGCDVIGPASSLVTARGMLERHAPDIVLLDIDMDCDGLSYDLASHIQHLGLPFLFITGYAASVVAEAGFGEATLLEKPVNLGAMLEQIEQACSFSSQNST